MVCISNTIIALHALIKSRMLGTMLSSAGTATSKERLQPQPLLPHRRRPEAKKKSMLAEMRLAMQKDFDMDQNSLRQLLGLGDGHRPAISIFGGMPGADGRLPAG